MKTAKVEQETTTTTDIDKIHKLIDRWLELGDVLFREKTAQKRQLRSEEEIIEKDIRYLLIKHLLKNKEISLYQIVFCWLRVPYGSIFEGWFETGAKYIIKSLTNDIFFKEYKRIEEKIKEKRDSIPPFLREIKEQKEKIAQNLQPNLN